MKKEEEKFIDSNIMEGMVSIRAILAGEAAGINDRKIEKILFSKDKIKSKGKELSYLKFLSADRNFPLEICDPAEIDRYAIGNTHGGILAFCSPRTIPAFSGEVLPQNGFFVMLEGIEDPYNFGYALRSLYAAGVDGILLPPRNWMTAAGVVCRASAGASEQFSLYTTESAGAAAMIMKERGYSVICADMDHSVSMYDADLKRPLFLIVGGEKRGISRAVLDCADAIIRLDYGREFKGALSAASAASILAFEVYRQNRS